MLAEVEGVLGAGHVLGVLDVLGVGELLRALHGEEQVAGAGGADGDGGEAFGDVVVVDGVEVGAFEAEVHKDGFALRGILRVIGVELDVLAVVELDEGLGDGGAVAAGIGEGLVEAELVVEGDRGGDVLDADGDVGDAVHGREGGRDGRRCGCGCGRGLGGREGREASGQSEQGDGVESGAAGCKGQFRGLVRGHGAFLSALDGVEFVQLEDSR